MCLIWSNVMRPPTPNLEWQITDKCNYACSYCFQQHSIKDCSQETINEVYKLLSTLDGVWLVKLIGGEPSLHPKFLEISKAIVESGHNICITTNFSQSIKKLKKFVDVCGKNLTYITASLHLSQIKNLDHFIDKANEFNKYIKKQTRFIVTSVLTHENKEALKEAEIKCSAAGISFKLQVLKTADGYYQYDKETERLLCNKTIIGTEKIRGFNSFGTICHTGRLFFRIRINGDVNRCFNYQPAYLMGNIAKGSFKRFSKSKPCMAKKCTCTVPVTSNMISFNHKAPAYNLCYHYIL